MGYKFMDGTLIEGSQWAQIKVVLFIDYNVAFTFIYFSHVIFLLELKANYEIYFNLKIILKFNLKLKTQNTNEYQWGTSIGICFRACWHNEWYEDQKR